MILDLPGGYVLIQMDNNMNDKDFYPCDKSEPLQAGILFGVMLGGIPMAFLAFHFWTKICH